MLKFLSLLCIQQYLGDGEEDEEEDEDEVEADANQVYGVICALNLTKHRVCIITSLIVLLLLPYRKKFSWECKFRLFWQIC